MCVQQGGGSGGVGWGREECNRGVLRQVVCKEYVETFCVHVCVRDLHLLTDCVRTLENAKVCVCVCKDKLLYHASDLQQLLCSVS